ncbi:zinc finger, GRF-type containing protein [Tanacetum coccineum]
MFIPRMCQCGLPTVCPTSWTQINPGRRFHCCPKVGDNCGFNGWFDLPMCPRAVVIIPGLLRNLNELREIANANAIKARRMKFLLGTDKAKITRKRSKPDKHGHENGRVHKEPEVFYQ